MPMARFVVRPIGALAATLLLLMLGPSGSASGVGPGATCASSKRTAAGKKIAAKLTCVANATIKGVAVNSLCLTNAEQKFDRAFTRAEVKARHVGGCATPGDAAAVEAVVDACVTNVRTLLDVAGSMPAASTCTADKLRATGTSSNAGLVCWAKAVAKGVPVDQTCLLKAVTRLSGSLVTAESRGDCLTVGDHSALSTAVDDCLGAIIPALPGPSTTTTSTTSTTTTSAGPTTTTHCSPEPAAVRGVTAAHNDVRARALPVPNPPVDPLCYSTTVQATAQAWAEGCTWMHNPGRGFLGENIAAYGSPSGSAVGAVALWAAEAADYDYPTNRCSGVCGHYTQIVWRSTQRLGCGVTVCTTGSPFGPGFPTWTFIVCDYDPPGNYVRQRPY